MPIAWSGSSMSSAAPCASWASALCWTPRLKPGKCRPSTNRPLDRTRHRPPANLDLGRRWGQRPPPSLDEGEGLSQPAAHALAHAGGAGKGRMRARALQIEAKGYQGVAAQAERYIQVLEAS